MNDTDFGQGVFTDEEANVLYHLLKANEAYAKLKTEHPVDIREWNISFHRLQFLLGIRILRREHSDIFYKSE